ncbi:MAG: hypothetical protein Gaeavirus33_5 [Gaeavirus sp.]|uniref:Uncharacterized protein n=1 Tax=Gaeavirus sp. TaxID=2487767 RepID=A0A3G5A1F6_9VIRU|nr:MAG: hypothetical protein Gaeavirus33_5 [Gaeavirus sp.]
MEEQLKKLGITSPLSESDMDALSKLLEGNGISLPGKSGSSSSKMTHQDKNKLLSSLSAHTAIMDNHKDIKDMTPTEREQYRSDLKRKLHEKQSVLTQGRTSKQALKHKLDKATAKIVSESTEETIDGVEETKENLTEAQPQVQSATVEKPSSPNPEVSIDSTLDVLEDYLN